MTRRAKKIQTEIVKRIQANGGHWAELEMKNGDLLIISRLGHTSFERLEADDFNVILNRSKRLYNTELASISNYIDETYK